MSEDLLTVQTQWSFSDLMEAHDILDALEEAEEKAAEPK